MNADSKSRDRKQLVWPVTGIVLGALVAIIPSTTAITLQAGIAAWCVDMGLVLILSAHPMGARIGALMAGLFMAVPCFVQASPLARGSLMCGVAAPFLAAAGLALASPIAGLRARVTYLSTWGGTHQVKRRARGLDMTLLLRLSVATVIFAAGVAVVKEVSGSGFWLPVRWFAGGILFIAGAEMITAGLPMVAGAFGLIVPSLFQSPYRSASVGEFWARRWNIGVSARLLRPFCFAPLARRGVVMALFASFALSGVAHALLAYMALARWRISLICGAFFLVQPLLIAAERRLAVRRWRPWAGRVWTLTALALTSPLFVEPALQVVEESSGAPDNVLLPTAVFLGFVIVASSIISLVSLASPATNARVYVA